MILDRLLGSSDDEENTTTTRSSMTCRVNIALDKYICKGNGSRSSRDSCCCQPRNQHRCCASNLIFAARCRRSGSEASDERQFTSGFSALESVVATSLAFFSKRATQRNSKYVSLSNQSILSNCALLHRQNATASFSSPCQYIHHGDAYNMLASYCFASSLLHRFFSRSRVFVYIDIGNVCVCVCVCAWAQERTSSTNSQDIRHADCGRLSPFPNDRYLQGQQQSRRMLAREKDK